jgi:hypothetical protein
MFFDLVSKNNNGIRLNREAAMLHPAFERLLIDEHLGETAFRFVSLVCDYRSPLRHYPQQDRVSKAIDILYGATADAGMIDSVIVREAMDAYEEMQRDADFNNYYALEEKCAEIARFFNETEVSAESIELLEKAGKTLKTLTDMKSSLKEIVFAKVEREDAITGVRAGKMLSFAEKKFTVK